MPSIPQYEQRTEAQGTINAQANPGDFGAQTAQAGQRLGAAGEQLASTGQMLLREQEERDAKAWSGDAVSKAHLQWFQTLKEKQESAPAGAPNFTPDLLKSFDDYTSQTVQNAPTPLAKQFLTQHLQSLRTSLGTQALGFESQARVDNRIAQAGESIDTWGKLVEQSPGSYDLAKKTLLETMPYAGPEKDRHLTDLMKKTLTNAAAANVLDADPYKMQEYTSKALGNGGHVGDVGVSWIDDATPEQIKTWNNAATTKIHMLEAEMARNAEARAKIAEKTFGDATDLTFKGQFMSDSFKTQLLAATKGTQWESATNELIHSQATTAGFASAPASDRDATLNTMRTYGADPKKGTDPASAKQLEKIQTIDGEIKKAVASNPWVAAQQYGVVKDSTAFPVATAADAVKIIQQRSTQQTQVESWAGHPISPLQPQETAQLTDALAKLPPPGKSQALAQLGAVLPIDRLTALADDIDKKDKPLALSMKLGAANTTAGRYVSELVLRGDQAIKDKTIKKDDSALSGWRSTIAGMVRGTLGDERAEQDVIDSAYYVRASMDADGTAVPGFKLDASERQAVKMVIGEPLERGGMKTFLPHDLTESQFDEKLKGYTAEKLKSLAPGGLFVRGKPMTFEQVAGGITDYGLRKDGRGNYLPSSGGAFITTADGKPLRLPVAP